MSEKHDKGKPRFSLLPTKALWAIVEVFEYGAKKYEVDGWKGVPNLRVRYYDAAKRHLDAWWQGERCDPESGLPHLAHVGANVLFLLWHDLAGGC